MTMEQLRQAPAPGLGLDPEDAGLLTPSAQADDQDAITEVPNDSDGMDDLPDGDRQLTTDSAALDGGGAPLEGGGGAPLEGGGDVTGGGNNDSDLGADVAGDIGPKHD